jgi:uroporphyrin-3 C-methyltransferase
VFLAFSISHFLFAVPRHFCCGAEALLAYYRLGFRAISFQVSDTTDKAAVPAANTPPDSADADSAVAAAPAAGRARWLGAVTVLALAALAFAGWNWHQGGVEMRALQQELARKLAESDARARESRLAAEQVREAVADTLVKLGVLEGRIAESQSQRIALEALYHELSRNRDEWAYAEIEQTLFIASQQLQLAGNVRAALIALQAADARLQRMERPQLAGLRKAINRDIERLKALPHVDAAAISARLEGLIAQVDKLPLAMDMRPQEQSGAARSEAEGSAWLRFWREAWAEFKQLVRVQHTAKPEAPLLAPSQSYFLRENLKLRLLGARLALLGRDAAAYKADLGAAREWLGGHYDTRDSNVAHALGALRSLQETDVSIEVPDISATLEAMRMHRPARERAVR